MLATITLSVANTFDALSLLAWIPATYMMGSAISTPLSEHLSDKCGRRWGLIISCGLVLVGLVLSGISYLVSEFKLFLAGRVIQGFGGGCLISIISYLESDVVPLRRRSLVEGLGNVVYGSMNAIGGYYGGLVTQNIGWDWAFFILCPLVVINMFILVRILGFLSCLLG
jgi:MFS family permease